VNAAYKSTYDLYHGFLIKQMFLGSFDAAPEVKVILTHMNTGRSRALINDADDITTSTTQTSASASSSSQGSPSVQAIPTSIITFETRSPLDVVVGHVTSEWLKIERFLKQCRGQQRNSQSRNLLIAVPEEEGIVAEEPKSDFAVARPPTSKQTSEEEIPAFVAVAQPMLRELQALITKLNMNDPSKC
jgi:hypothetical protein